MQRCAQRALFAGAYHHAFLPMFVVLIYPPVPGTRRERGCFHSYDLEELLSNMLCRLVSVDIEMHDFSIVITEDKEHEKIRQGFGVFRVTR